MSLYPVCAKNPAGQALVRILRLALPDERTLGRLLRGALRSANRAELPSDGEELLGLVHAHLAPQLSKDVPPNLVFALLDDLKAEIEQQRAPRDAASGSRLEAATCAPPPIAPHGGGALPLDPPFPKLRASVSHLRRTTGMLRAAPAPCAAASVAPAAGGTASVVLVESDRMLRASLARALVGARFRVSVLGTIAELGPSLRGCREDLVVVIDVVADGADAALRDLAQAHPAVSVVAWTEAPPAIVEHLLSITGLRRFRVVSKACAALDVVDGVRALCAHDAT